jgi:hypothetical protein
MGKARLEKRSYLNDLTTEALVVGEERRAVEAEGPAEEAEAEGVEEEDDD